MEYTENDIKTYLGDIIFYRAKDYFNKNKVLIVAPEQKAYHGEVLGSGGQIYSVEVGYDGYHNCSCPYNGPCKHIGAVLLELLQIEQEVENFDPVEEFRHYETLKSQDLEEFNKEMFNDSSWRGINKNNNGRESSFKVQFQIVCSNTNKPLIKAVLRYIKKDGDLGRTENFSYSKNITDITSNSEAVLNYLQLKMDYQESLHTCLPLLQYQEQDIVYKDSIVNIKSFNRVEVNFTPHIKTNHNVTFTPLFNLYNGDELLAAKIPLRDIEPSPGRITVFDKNSKTILVNNSFNMINKFFIKIDNLFALFYKDITLLKEKFDDSTNIIINFNLKGIKSYTLKPVPVLKLREGYSGVELDIYFRYKNEELHINSSKDISKPVIETDYIEVLERDYMFEDLFLAYLNKIISGLKPAYNWEKHNYYYSGFLDRFIQLYGKTLVDDGVILNVDKKDITVSKGTLGYSVENKIDWFDIKLYLKDENGISTPITANTINSSIIKASSGYFLLDKESIKSVDSIKRQAEVKNDQILVNKNNFNMVDFLYNNKTDNSNKALEKQYKIQKSLKNFSGIEEQKITKGFKGKLRDYQKAGYNWLQFLHKNSLNGCLADDMGLGKTVQTLALLQSLKDQNKFKTSLLVVPVVTMGNWEKECEKFTPEIVIEKHEGSKRVKDIDYLKEFDLIIVSYHTLIRDIELFSSHIWYYLILDEAQYIKNPKTKLNKGIRSIKAEHRLSLTGTPVENSTTDLYSQMEFLNPGILGKLEKFNKEYAKPIDKNGNSDIETELSKRVNPLILRRKKEDVLKDLPEKEIVVQYIEMGSKQKKLYNSYKKSIRDEVVGIIKEKGIEKSTISILDALLKLRQIALFPQLISDEYKKTESCKMDTLKIMLQDIIADGHKVLIFSQFVKTLEIIELWLNESKLEYSKITGKTKDRTKEIDNFNNSNKVFLLSLKAGGVGINLTSADYVILFDPWWNPAVENQAIDRCYRIGQKNKVFAYKMIVKDTVEEKIIELQNKKKELAEGLVSAESGIIKSLTKDDLMGLFQ
ncbi:hypothetical protein EW093_12995 [Thiospirochaeta perfilievii]|uniref:DEAD/DEAH box helicase n=1 Tax=Thiospirochaeta perfilievii TaxID=252967 RepID=A0A5C1QDE7_9SPIO|nr:DEAD/DEAH box helicase [Thiospirochaeta perfilievii]QEN05591.1 hypothetical protein EW093_12995 [Thiospirochaeta perfilievii]